LQLLISVSPVQVAHFVVALQTLLLMEFVMQASSAAVVRTHPAQLME
jgi:hypothetical protein